MGSVPPDHLLDEPNDPSHSNLGGAPVDDDEALDELQPYAPSGVGRAVPTLIEWTAPGDKIYVTGTFVNWEKKFRLHRRYVIFLLISSGIYLTATRLHMWTTPAADRHFDAFLFISYSGLPKVVGTNRVS